jgi:redox-sensitive bicupin YhaK (pirin superfamily)
MTEREIKEIVVPAQTTDGAGVKIRRSIGTARLDRVDPFFLFDHFGSEDPDDYIAGFPMHPHRGIETITYMLDGSVAHRDSIGNSGVIGAGDIQWMTAGSGIMHEEMPKAGPERLDGFQIWVNMPRALKMTEPRYQNISSKEIPETKRPDGTRIRIIAGNVNGVSGAVKDIFADPTYLDVTMQPLGLFEQPVASGHTGLLYLFEGSIGIGDTGESEVGRVSSVRLILLNDGDALRVRAGNTGARFLLLSAKPLNEEAVRWGPFVMNTKQEIEETLQELRDGTFIKSPSV